MTGTAPHRPATGREVDRYAYVQRPYEDVWYWLANHLGAIGAPLPDGSRLVQLRIRPGGVEVNRPVRLHMTGFVCGEERARLGVGWVDAVHPHLFPELEGVLELAPVPNDNAAFTQIGLVARYRPPFGPLGAIGDRLVGGEVADAAVTIFLDELARLVEEHIDPPSLAPDPEGSTKRPVPDDPDVHRTFLTIDGLAVRRGGAVGAAASLATTPGVVRVGVDPRSGLASVDHDPARCSAAQLATALDEQAAPGSAA